MEITLIVSYLQCRFVPLPQAAVVRLCGGEIARTPECLWMEWMITDCSGRSNSPNHAGQSPHLRRALNSQATKERPILLSNRRCQRPKLNCNGISLPC